MSRPPLRNLYPQITSFSTLLSAFRKAAKGKRYRPEVLAFAANLEAELFRLQHELRSFTYAPGPYRQFTIREPKPRLVSAAPFRDRVVHHALIAVIGPPLERRFIPTSYANRQGYGTHRALRRFARACREHRWVLQADIRLYFPSIDHQLLLAQLEPLIACTGTLWLLRIRRGLRRCARGLLRRRLRIEAARASATSWNAHLAHGHTLQLRRRLFSPYPFCDGLLPSAALR